GKMYTLMIELRGYEPVRRSIDLSMTHAYESITLQPEMSDKVREVPPEGAGAAVNARLLQVSDEAKKEFAAGRQAMVANDLMASVDHLQKAVELAPNFAEAYQLMGGAYLQLNRLAASRKALEQAISIDDHLPGAHVG